MEKLILTIWFVPIIVISFCRFLYWMFVSDKHEPLIPDNRLGGIHPSITGILFWPILLPINLVFVFVVYGIIKPTIWLRNRRFKNDKSTSYN